MTQKQIKAILFDCDGTLVDTEIIHASAAKEIFKSYGIEQHDEFEFVGVHLTDILDILNARHKTDITVDGYLDVYIDYMHQNIPMHIRILEETSAYVRDLHNRGYPMAVGSNGQHEVVMAELKAVNLLPYFEAVITAEGAIRPKPYPDMYLEGMKACGVDDPESCVVVEDSVTGIKAAVAGGMVPVGYIGFSPSPDALAIKLKEAGAFCVVDTLQGLDFLLK